VRVGSAHQASPGYFIGLYGRQYKLQVGVNFEALVEKVRE